MGSILKGTGCVIDHFFGLERFGTSPHFKHKQSCVHVSNHPLPTLGGKTLLTQLYSTIQTNRRESHYNKPPSKENWRVEPRDQLDEKNASPEVTLERTIIQASDTTWGNQVPTSSGMTGPHFDKVRNIDLVHNMGSGAWEFIELKVKSDTPLYAAMEILQYGLLFLFSRAHQKEFGYDKNSKELLRASQVHLRVLAPYEYYTPYRSPQLYQLQWLEAFLNEGLHGFLKDHIHPALHMDFQFEAFPLDFQWPQTNGAKDVSAIRLALRDRVPVYSHAPLSLPTR